MNGSTSRPRQLTLQEMYLRQAEDSSRGLQQEHEQSIRETQEALEQDDGNPDLYLRLANLVREQTDESNALDILCEGIRRCAPSRRLYDKYIAFLEESNRIREAIAAAQEALRLFPGDLNFKWREALALPVVYQNPDEIEYFRRRFANGLAVLDAEISLETPKARRTALEAGSRDTNFFLAYQGCDDRDLQHTYGKLVHRIVAANFSHWVKPIPLPPIEGKLRIGYASSVFCEHSVSKIFLRWLREHDRGQFEVYAYHVGKRTDATTDEARRCGAGFRHVPGNVEDAARAIQSDKLHILVHLDIGMHPTMTLLGAMRLAPIQCAAWGHPVTTGLPTVDHFLSSALMEPANGQEHYLEQLIRLPGIGVCYQQPVIPRAILGKRRPNYGLRENAVLYLSCQSTFKYLPQHDDVFPSIAKRVSSAQFVFLTPNKSVREAFRSRLDLAFSAMGLSAADYCVLLPVQDHFSYWNLNLLADVYLDTIEWSGFNTTLEAIACGLPIVTLPGQFMRGRHSYAILAQLDATETIARDKADYVDIAVRLGEDRAWRQSVVQRMKDGCRRFYSDIGPLAALEDFFRDALKQHSIGLNGQVSN